MTKKPFGVFITPENSPVSPEEFRGYHTGADFEVPASEDETTVEVPALCDGTIVLARRATGYGGVVVEQCTVDNETVTVIYGHLALRTLTVRVGDSVVAGESLGKLGRGFTAETDGERPHLHLGVHRGTSISLLGYVQAQSDLAAWRDPLAVVK